MISLLPSGGCVLVVGGATLGDGLRVLYEADLDIVAFDIYGTDLVQIVADAHQLPFRGASFDAVVVQAVLEHVLEPVRVVAEIWRVLKPDGLVYAETPFLQPIHEGAFDFQRFTDSGHRWLFRKFECLRAGAVGGVGTQFIWSWNYLVRSLFRSRRAGLVARTVALPLQTLDRLIPEKFSIDAAAGVFFMGRRSDDNVVTAAEMVRYYRGAQR